MIIHLPTTDDKAQIHIKDDHTCLSQQWRASFLHISIGQSAPSASNDELETQQEKTDK